MDPNKYTYEKTEVDKAYNSIIQKEECYPVVGIFLNNKQVIGQMSFKRINHEESKCELGISLANDSYKGLGYGTDAIELAIQYVFNSLKLQFIYADTMGSNIAMQKIFKKFGFEHVNTEERRYDMLDRWEDKLIYVLRVKSSSH